MTEHAQQPYEKATLWQVEGDRPVPREMEIVGEMDGLPVYFRMVFNPQTLRHGYEHVVFNSEAPGPANYFETEEKAWAWLCGHQNLRVWVARWICDRIYLPRQQR